MSVKIYLDTDNETKKLYDEQLYRETQKETFFDKFKSKNGGSVIWEKSNFTKDKGDTVYFYMISKLNEQGYFTQGQTISGNEQALTSYRDSVSLAEYSLATAWEGGLSEQRPVFSISDEAERALKEAGAGLSDQLIFDALYTGTPSKIYKMTDTPALSGTAAALTTADKITPKKISYIKTAALSGWPSSNVRTQEPYQPVMVDGKPHLVLLVHPYALFDLKQDSTYQQFMREAENRGKDNPLFTGAIAVIDGVIIHESERVPFYTTGGSGSDVPYCKGLLLGKNALVMANGKRESIEMETRNYKKITGYCWSLIRGHKRTAFNSKDWACAEVFMACTNLSA